MALVLDKLQSLLPHNSKTSPSGWISFNAPCCHHRGHKIDERKRGGVMFSDSFVYNCFNCKYTAYWEPGWGINEKLKKLCKLCIFITLSRALKLINIIFISNS